MVPRWLLTTLVFALPILVVAFAVVMGGYALAQGLGDQAGARALLWVALSALLLGIMDLVVLLVVLGLRALADSPDDHDDSTRPG